VTPVADPGRPTFRGRLILGAAWIVARLPERPLVAAANAAGSVWYRVAPAKAAQARANLGRVCVGLAAQDRGSALVRRAATDPAALDQIVRQLFRHAARYYLEVLRAGRYESGPMLARIDILTPDEVRDGLQSGQPVILAGMHYGAIEVATIAARSMIGSDFVAPMELVDDPALRNWFVTTRSRVGVQIIPIKDARRVLLKALKAGVSVGLVSDRDILGGGLSVPFFGHPAPIPPGAPMLAIETGIPLYVAVARRMEHLRYQGSLTLVPMPPPGPLRVRLTALTASMVRGFEDLLAEDPAQWWGAFHPIWPDLALGAAPAGHRPSGQEAAS
jgi:KDO2-lipid IV(A) lauroyltransferase